jgi:NADPH2:quinone reductase
MGVTMRALAFTRPAPDTGATEVIAVPVPEPGSGQVAIDVARAGINFKDVMSRRGDPGYAPSWPFVPGAEVSGTVRALGPGVTHLRPGQAVVALTNQGGLAEVALADAELTVPVPAGLDLTLAAAAPAAPTTAELLLRRARVRPGDAVLVHSASGAVGRAVAQLAGLIGGVELVAAVGSASRTAPARAAGYHHVVVRGADLARDVRTVLGGRGVDVVLDPQGTAFLEPDLAVLAPAGLVVLFGDAGGGGLGPLPATGALYGANASVGGFSLAALSASAPGEVVAAMTTVLGHLGAGRLTVDVTEVPALEHAAAAQQALADGTGAGKYVVTVT